MSFLINSCPGSEHMYLYVLATTTPGRLRANSDSSSTSTVAGDVGPAMTDVDADPGLFVGCDHGSLSTGASPPMACQHEFPDIDDTQTVLGTNGLDRVLEHGQILRTGHHEAVDDRGKLQRLLDRGSPPAAPQCRACLSSRFDRRRHRSRSCSRGSAASRPASRPVPSGRGAADRRRRCTGPGSTDRDRWR